MFERNTIPNKKKIKFGYLRKSQLQRGFMRHFRGVEKNLFRAGPFCNYNSWTERESGPITLLASTSNLFAGSFAKSTSKHQDTQ